MIANLNIGGAQTGMLSILKNGLCEQAEVTIVSAAFQEGGLLSKFQALAPVIVCGAPKKAMSFLKTFYHGWRQASQSDIFITSLVSTNLFGRVIRFFHPHIMLVVIEVIPDSIDHGRFIRWLLKQTSRLVDYCANDSQGTLEGNRDLYEPYGVKMGIVQTIGTPVNACYVGPPLPGQPIRLVSVGRLASQKNYAVVIRELALMRAKRLPVTLTLVGGGPQQEELEALARELGVEQQIVFVGMSNTAQLFLAKGDIYIQSSWLEGLCLTVVEAMAAGLPIITTNVGGVRDYTRDGVNCLHFDSDLPGDLTSKVERLVHDPALCRTLSQGALQTVSTQFSPEAQYQSLQRLLQEVESLRAERERRRGLIS